MCPSWEAGEEPVEEKCQGEKSSAFPKESSESCFILRGKMFSGQRVEKNLMRAFTQSLKNGG